MNKISFQSYQGMKEIAYDRVKGSDSLFSSEFESNIHEIYDALGSLENHYLIKQSLEELHNNGPYRLIS